MNKEHLKLLQDWQKSYQNFRKEEDKLSAVFGGGINESGLFNCAYKLFDNYTDVLSKLIGDNNDWLNWWMFETQCGEKGTKVKIGGKMREIKNLKDLLKVIDDTRGES